MSMVGFPLLLIPLAIYNIVAFLMPGVSFDDPLVRLTLMSGAQWPITLADMLLALGVLLLLLEVIKGARGGKYLTDHLLSLIVFGAAAAEFLLLPKFANSTFCLLALLAMVDFISGIALRRRRPTPAAASVSRRAADKAETRVVEPRPEPARPVAQSQAEPQPAPRPAAAPSAASVAESVLKDNPEPKPAQPVATPNESSSQLSSTVPSSDFQPTGNSQASPEPPQR
jgi:hypothetical protein